MAVTLDELPSEIIQHILLYVPPTSVTKVQQVSHQFNKLALPTLWRRHCRTQFTYWDPHHGIQQMFLEPVDRIDWRKTFALRYGADFVTTHEIDSILATQPGRIEKTERIIAQGYDAKDALLRNLEVDDLANDVLARRFYSDAVLGSLHRRMAIEQWVSLRDGRPVSLESALSAFNMFVLHGRRGDFDEISTVINHIVEEIRSRLPALEDKSTRQKAIAIADYLRESNLVGIRDDAQYHDLQNNFIGIALLDANHPSLPLISVAIFCCVAVRLGVDAHPCGFPFHVLAIVKPPPGRTLDGQGRRPDQAAECMYMDPFRSSLEIDVENLKAQLRSIGVPSNAQEGFLDASPVEEIVRRCAKNILTSVQTPIRQGPGLLSTAPSHPEMEGALYSALWSLLLLPDEGTPTLQHARYLRFVVEKIESEYVTDVGLVEKHILPIIRDPDQSESLMNTVRVVRTGDQMSKQIKHRTPDTEGRVNHRVGQVFHHKRYHYQAVITGWDVECEAGEQWIATMNVRSLSKGQHQSFYHVLVEDRSVRYVAEENIEIIDRKPSPKLMALAGQHFKRWDGTAMRFISNIKDEYPDD